MIYTIYSDWVTSSSSFIIVVVVVVVHPMNQITLPVLVVVDFSVDEISISSHDTFVFQKSIV